MKINRKNNKKQKNLLLFTVSAILLLSVGAYLLLQNTPNQQKSTKLESEDSKSTSTDTPHSDPSNKASSNPSPDVDSQKTSDEIPMSTSNSVNISQLYQSDDSVSYSATVTGSQTGKCSALFTNPIGKPVTRVSEATDGTCKATIPVQEFDALGEWELKLTFYSDNTQSTATKNLIIN